jgi:hypothetical protein
VCFLDSQRGDFGLCLGTEKLRSSSTSTQWTTLFILRMGEGNTGRQGYGAAVACSFLRERSDD